MLSNLFNEIPKHLIDFIWKINLVIGEFVPDNMQKRLLKIYNSKINSIDYAKFPFDSCLVKYY